MKPLRTSSSKAKSAPIKWVMIGWLALSWVGFLDATYLAIQHYRGASLRCFELSHCDEVTGSRYAVIGGIPIALLGAVYYLSILLLTVAYFDTKNTRILSIIPLLTVLGFLASLVLVYLQVFVIHAICLYCMFSALTSTALFILAVISRKGPHDESWG